MAASCAAAPSVGGYRPREAFLSPLWRLVHDHLDAFVRHYDERHRATHGALGPHMEKVFNQFLECGDPNRGVTLLKCDQCGHSLAVPFSCKTRVCPSCMTRRCEDLAEGLEPLLPRVPYRHVVVSLPRLMGIRHRIREDAGLMRRVVRLVMGVLGRTMAAQVPGGEAPARPGAIVAVQTFGDSLSLDWSS